jgi:hypothetical protein
MREIHLSHPLIEIYNNAMEKRITLKILSFCSAAIVLCSVVFINKKDNISSDITNTHLSTCSSHSNYCPEDAKVVRDFTNGKLD